VLWLNTGTNSFTPSVVPITGVSLGKPAAGDINNDGYVDIVIPKLEIGSYDHIILKNNGGNSFTTLTFGNMTGGGTCINLLDFNGDGFLDIFLGKTTYNEIWLNDETGAFPASSQTFIGTPTLTQAADFADVNNDGTPEALLATEMGDKIIYQKNNGEFDSYTPQILSYESGSREVASGDFNKDGLLDIVFAGTDDADVYNHNSDATFNLLHEFAGDSTVQIIDFDGDDNLDLMLPSNIQKNDGFGDFNSLGFSPTGISIAADFNNDGRIDIFSSNNISNKIWLNNPLAFTVDDIVPSNLSTYVSTASSIYVTFNDFPDPTSFNPTSFTLINSNNVQVSGYFEFNDFQVSFTPFEPLESNMEYTITLTNELKSLAGISLTASTTSTFTTENVGTPILGTLNESTICAGETAYFEIAPTNATPYGSVSFQWQVDEGLGAGFVDIFNNEIYKITPDFIMGIPTSTLEIQNASHLLNGFQFQCIVSNEAGSATTDQATLTVLGQKADAGDDVSVFTTTIPIPAVTAQLNAETLIMGVSGIWTCSNINVTLTNPTANITTANNISEGATIFYWTITAGGGCESSDQVIVYSGASIITTGTLTNWNDPASWFPPAVPGPNDSITVFNTNLDLSGINAVCGELYIGSGSNVIVADNGKGNGSLRSRGVVVEQDIEKFKGVKGPASLRIGSGGSVVVEQDIEKSAAAGKGISIGSGGSVVVEQDIEKDPKLAASLTIRSNEAVFVGKTVVGSEETALFKIGSGGSVVVEQDIEKSAAGGKGISIGSGGSVVVEQDIEKGATELRIRGGGVVVEQDIEKGFTGDALLEIKGGNLIVEQDLTTTGTNGIYVGNNGKFTAESGLTGASAEISIPELNIKFGHVVLGKSGIKSSHNVNIRSGGVVVEQDIEKKSSTDANLVINSEAQLIHDATIGNPIGGFISIKQNASVTVEADAQFNYTYQGAGLFLLQENASLLDHSNNLNAKSWYLKTFHGTEFIAVPTVADEGNKFRNGTAEEWDETLAAWNNVSSEDSIHALKGFKTDYTLLDNIIFRGDLYSSDISTPVSSTSSLSEFQRGWNYIGNPYPCTVNFNLLTLTDIHPVKYTYNQSTNNFDVYMQNGVSTNGAGPYLGLGECFITKAFENVETANFDFKESARLHFFDALKSSEPKSGILELKITNALGTQNDFASVAFNPAATGNFDESFDAWELYPAYMSSMSLYTLSTDSKQLAINTIPEPSSSITEVTMGFKKVNIGNYTISVTQNTLDAAVGVSLRDNGTNPVTLIDLRTTPTYTFNELSGSPEQRFTLIFDGSSSVSDISSDISIFGGKQSIQILSDKIMNTVSIEIIDISGRTVYSGFVNGNNQTIPVSAAEGIYLVKLTDNEQIKTTKVYITK